MVPVLFFMVPNWNRLCTEVVLAKLLCTELDNFGTKVDWY